VLAALGICVAGAPGYEAEDVIATLAARAGGPVEVVSGDRDLFALVRDPDVRVLYPVKGVSTLVEVDEAEVTRRYGIPGRAYLDYAILRGDPSDGLPGVPGIGEKTASHLIATHGSLAGVLEARDLPGTLRRRLEGAAAYLAAAVRVVAPVADAPVRKVDLGLPARPAHPRRLAALVETHKLAGPVTRLQTALADLEATTAQGRP
jgi:5'-3' exonuclease